MRKVSFAFGEYYHIYNRGNSKQKIFQDKNDYLHFMFLLSILNTDKNVELRNIKKDNLLNIKKVQPIVSIGAYVLMPNHFHILITEKIDGGVSKFMQKLSTAYVMYYNKKHTRTGSLFEGKFKSEHLHTDNYLKYIFSYIHLNPIKLIQKDWKEKGISDKNRALEFLKTYNFSSYFEYIGVNRKEVSIINIKDFPDYFTNTSSFSKEILTWLNYKEDI